MCLHTVPKQSQYGLDDPHNKRSYWFRGGGGSLGVFNWPFFFLPLNRAGSTTSKNPRAVFFLPHLPAFLPLHHGGGTVGHI